jgi:hypothetical protein
LYFLIPSRTWKYASLSLFFSSFPSEKEGQYVDLAQKKAPQDGVSV